jgi:hypothetical protein
MGDIWTHATYSITKTYVNINKLTASTAIVNEIPLNKPREMSRSHIILHIQSRINMMWIRNTGFNDYFQFLITLSLCFNI